MSVLKSIWLKRTAFVCGIVGMAGFLGANALAGDSSASAKSNATRNHMYITGSSLMAPFTNAVVERITAKGSLPVPKVVIQGTAKGVQEFCSGNGYDNPDVVAVSRRMRIAEYGNCVKNGVTDIVEVLVGYEAVALVVRKEDHDYDMTLASLYRAIANEYPDGDEFFLNVAKTWNEVDPKLPNTEIKVLLPSPQLGARGFFDDRVLQAACRHIHEIKTIFSAPERVRQCTTLRRDGRVVDVGMPLDTNIAAHMRSAKPGTMAVMSLRHAALLGDNFKLLPLDGVVPNRKTVGSHEYEVTRPLYYYIKKSHIKDYTGKGMVSGLREFITELTRDETIGQGGYFTQLGVVPMHDAQRIAVRQAALRLTVFER
jgi:phosphate transport system substrate-binding protein